MVKKPTKFSKKVTKEPIIASGVFVRLYAGLSNRVSHKPALLWSFLNYHCKFSNGWQDFSFDSLLPFVSSHGKKVSSYKAIHRALKALSDENLIKTKKYRGSVSIKIIYKLTDSDMLGKDGKQRYVRVYFGDAFLGAEEAIAYSFIRMQYNQLSKDGLTFSMKYRTVKDFTAFNEKKWYAIIKRLIDSDLIHYAQGVYAPKKALTELKKELKKHKTGQNRNTIRESLSYLLNLQNMHRNDKLKIQNSKNSLPSSITELGRSSLSKRKSAKEESIDSNSRGESSKAPLKPPQANNKKFNELKTPYEMYQRFLEIYNNQEDLHLKIPSLPDIKEALMQCNTFISNEDLMKYLPYVFINWEEIVIDIEHLARGDNTIDEYPSLNLLKHKYWGPLILLEYAKWHEELLLKETLQSLRKILLERVIKLRQKPDVSS